MKKIAILILPLVLILSGCKKSTDNISTFTYYADIVLNGDAVVTLQLGDVYTDAGAKAYENGVEIPVTTDNSVNVDEPGVYTVDYSATNVDGYSSTKSRIVAVLPGVADPGAADLSGKYYYIATGRPTTDATIWGVTKFAPGFYYSENTYSSALTIAAYIFCLDGVTISIPEFESAFGPYYGSGTYDDGTGDLTYVVNIPAFGIFGRNRFWTRYI